MQTHNNKATRSIGAHCWFVIALAVGMALGAPALAQRTATATATVVEGLVAAITITDGGSGYPVAPQVTITGGGGSGASA